LEWALRDLRCSDIASMISDYFLRMMFAF